MRLLAGIFLIMATLIVGAYLYAVDYPYYKYSHWISGQDKDRLYEISRPSEITLVPPNLEKISVYKEDYVQLWKGFPLRNSLIPMPTRHPLFQTVPIVEMQGKTGTPNFGIILQDPTGREISRVYTLPNRLYQDQSQGH